jgi:hypothetical protein
LVFAADSQLHPYTSTNGRLRVGRRRIFHPDTEKLACFFALPPGALAQRMLHPDSARDGTMSDAAAAKPALIGIQHDRRLVLFRIGDQDIRAAHFYAIQTASA